MYNMKEKWNKIDKLEKISLLLFISALIMMTIGLILIGLAKHGFVTLKTFGVGGVLQINRDVPSFYLDGMNLSLIQYGDVLYAIITPILFGLSILTLGYYVYKIKIKGTIKTNCNCK